MNSQLRDTLFAFQVILKSVCCWNISPAMIKGQSGLKVKRLAGIALTWRMTESLQVIPLREKGHTRQIIRLKCYKEITFSPHFPTYKYFSNVPNIVLLMTILVLFLKTPLTDACLHTDAHTQSSLMNFPVESHTSYKSLASVPSPMISFICLKYWQSNREILKRKKKKCHNSFAHCTAFQID